MTPQKTNNTENSLTALKKWTTRKNEQRGRIDNTEKRMTRKNRTTPRKKTNTAENTNNNEQWTTRKNEQHHGKKDTTTKNE